MKSVFVAGSRKFFEEIERLVRTLKEKGIEVFTAEKPKDIDTESEKAALLRAFQKIDKSDILYVFARDGYIGKTVAMEIAYAFSKGKKIISSEAIEEPSAKSLVSEIMNTKELAECSS